MNVSYEYLNVADVARMLKKSSYYIYKMIKNNQIPKQYITNVGDGNYKPRYMIDESYVEMYKHNSLKG